MRYGPDDKFFVVTDAAPDSTLADVCFETSLRSLDLQFRGGLSMDRHPTMFSDCAEAEAEAQVRLAAASTAEAVAARAAAAIATAPGGQSLRGAARVQVLNASGSLLLAADLG